MFTDLEIKNKYQDALQLVSEGNFQEAYDELTNILSNALKINHKLKSEIIYLRATIDISHINNHFEETIDDFQYLIHHKTKYVKESCAILTLMYEGCDDFREVMHYGELAISLDSPFKKDIYFALAKSYAIHEEKELLQKALKYINLCIKETDEENTDVMQPLVTKIDILISLKDFSKAEEALNDFAIQFGSIGTYYYLYARLYFQMYISHDNDVSLLDKVIENGLRCLQYDEKEEIAKVIISQAYYLKKDYQKALMYLEKMEEDEFNIIERVKIYEEIGEYQKGIELIDQSQEKYSSWRFTYLKGVLKLSLHLDEEARKTFVDAFHQSHYHNILFDIIDIDRKQKNDMRSYSFLQKELDNKENDVGILNQRLGELALKVGQSYDQMLDYYRKAYEQGAMNELEYVDVISDYVLDTKNLQKIIKKYITPNFHKLKYTSKRKMAVRYLYGEMGFKQNIKRAYQLIRLCIEENGNDPCDESLLGRCYEFMNKEQLAYEAYQRAYQQIKDEVYPECDCAYGYYAHALIQGIGVSKDIEEGKKIILDAIQKSDKFASAHIIYYYSYFALQNDERFSKEKAYELLTFDYPFYRFDITRITILTQLCNALHMDSEKCRQLEQTLKYSFHKEELKYYYQNRNLKNSLPYWKNI